MTFRPRIRPIWWLRLVMSLVMATAGFFFYQHATADHNPYKLSSLSKVHAVPHQPTNKLIALSFDDGPDPAITPYVLEILKRMHVPGTFFEVGKRVDKYPQLSRKVVLDGHTVGNHSYTHPDFSALTLAEQQQQQVYKTQAAIQRATGVTPHLFRFPEGATANIPQDWLYQADILPTYWYEPTDTDDWQGPGPAKILAKLKANTAPGAVILMHDYPVASNGKNQLSFLPAYITWAENHGYTFAHIAPNRDHLNSVVRYSEIKLVP